MRRWLAWRRISRQGWRWRKVHSYRNVRVWQETSDGQWWFQDEFGPWEKGRDDNAPSQ